MPKTVDNIFFLSFTVYEVSSEIDFNQPVYILRVNLNDSDKEFLSAYLPSIFLPSLQSVAAMLDQVHFNENPHRGAAILLSLELVQGSERHFLKCLF